MSFDSETNLYMKGESYGSRRLFSLVFLFVPLILFFTLSSCTIQKEKVGVLYVLHGGMDTNKPMYMWDASVQMFAYDQNHAVYKFVIKNPDDVANGVEP